MPVLRTKSVGTKVTDEEFGRLAALAGGQRLSEWLRDPLLAIATPRPADQVLLAEFLALRRIELNLPSRRPPARRRPWTPCRA